MADAEWVREHADRSFRRLWPRLETSLREPAAAAPEAWSIFESRLRHEWERLFGLLFELYGGEYDFFYHLEELVAAAARSWFARPEPAARRLPGPRRRRPESRQSTWYTHPAAA